MSAIGKAVGRLFGLSQPAQTVMPAIPAAPPPAPTPAQTPTGSASTFKSSSPTFVSAAGQGAASQNQGGKTLLGQ